MPSSRSDIAVEEVVVPKESNAVVVRAREHGWVAIARHGAELVRESSGSPEATFVVSPGTYSVHADGTIEHVEATAIDLPPDPFAPSPAEKLLLLRLTSDAPDQHVVDGVGEIPADGESSCTITVEKLDAAGQPVRRRHDTDEVFLRSTGGTIMHREKDEHIRSVKLKAGRAAFRVVSEPVPRLVTVSALGEGSPAPVELQIEFV